MGPRKAGSFPATSDRCRPAHRPARRAPVGPRFHQQGGCGSRQAQHCCPCPVPLPRTLCPSSSWAPRHAPAATRWPSWITQGTVGGAATDTLPALAKVRRLSAWTSSAGSGRNASHRGSLWEWDEVSRPSLHPVSSPRPVLRASAVIGSVRARPSRGLSSTEILALAALRRSIPAGLCRAAERDKEVSRRGTGGSSCASLAHGSRAATPRRMAGLRRPEGRGPWGTRTRPPVRRGGLPRRRPPCVCQLARRVLCCGWSTTTPGHEVVARSVEKPYRRSPGESPHDDDIRLADGRRPLAGVGAEGTPRGGSRRWRRP